jgi:hypothetical protein
VALQLTYVFGESSETPPGEWFNVGAPTYAPSLPTVAAIAVPDVSCSGQWAMQL